MKGVPITLTPVEKQKKRKKEEEGIYKVEIVEENGEWKLYINDSKTPLPASCVEVFLYQELMKWRNNE